MTENPSRRTFVKGVAATGTVATGLAAFGGQAGAQQDGPIGDVTAVLQDGLVNVTIGDVTVEDIDVITVRVRDVVVEITDNEILNDADILSNIEIDLRDVNVNALNNLNVVVQALSGGSVVQTVTQRVENQ